MKKIAIIGGSGFIGTRLCDRISSRDDIDFGVFDLVKNEKYADKTSILDLKDIDSIRSSINGYHIVINLAAEHKDNVFPVSRYHETNVIGQKNLCAVMQELDIKHLIFTSSVAVYGFVTEDTDESGKINPFHEYGMSKYKAELEAESWFSEEKSLSVVRPTVVFGEGNKGNVYNLLKQISSGKFLMIGSGTNKKSMAYVENIAAFLEHLIDKGKGHQIFNFIDKPDFDMNELVSVVNRSLGKKENTFRVPYLVGLLGGYCFDLLSLVLRRQLPISSLRIKKFCARTQFKSKTDYLGFKPPVSLSEGLSKTVKADFK